jgi:hypothetical protein
VTKNPEKPPLTVVAPASIGGSPPRKLGRHGLALWTAIIGDYDITDRGGIELLTQACGALDRVEALAERINADGEVM